MADHIKLAEAAFKLLQETGNSEASWAVRSKAALLLTLVIKRMGQPFWEELLPGLVAFAAHGPVQAQKVRRLRASCSSAAALLRGGSLIGRARGLFAGLHGIEAGDGGGDLDK